jgi:hypothetical protein
MTESRENSPFLTPTYQTIFILDLTQINECFFEKDYYGSFAGLRMLFSDLLAKPQEEIKGEWDKFLQDEKASQGKYMGSEMDFLYNNIPEIKAKFIRILEKHNLLNVDYGAKPKYRKKAHLTVPR